MITVKNMTSERTGKAVANQFIIHVDEENNYKTVFQSYESPIIEVNHTEKTITVYRDYAYSNTTIKYRNRFMYYMGFRDMSNTKGFEYYMNLGAIGDYDIVKAF